MLPAAWFSAAGRREETKLRASKALLVATLVLSGCATEAQHHAQEIGNTAKAAMAQARQCQSILEANPKYARIYQKLGVATAKDLARAPTAAQLSDSEIVSDDDKALGFEWYAEGQDCVVTSVEALGRIDPEIGAYIADRYSERADLLNDIASNQQTYGQINAKIATLKQHDSAAGAELAHSLKTRLAAQHQQELAEQQAAAEELVSDIGTIALAVATRGRSSVNNLAARESALARAQLAHAKRYPRYIIVRQVRPIRCDGIGRSLRCALSNEPGPATETEPAPPMQSAAISTPPPRPKPALASPGGVVSVGYRAMLSAWLESHKRYPDSARSRGEEGRAVLHFRVDRSGRLLNFAVVQSTGYADLDAAIDDMMRGASLPPFPPDMTARDIDVTVGVSFGLTHPATPNEKPG